MNKILIIDDEVKIMKGLRRMLLFEGYEPLQTTDPHEALILVENGGIGLVISDYRMPEMNGLQLAAAIRKKRPELPIFLLTGYADKSLVLRAREKGLITAVVTKPWSEIRLLLKIKQHFMKPSSIVSNSASRDGVDPANSKKDQKEKDSASRPKLLIMEDDRMTQAMYQAWLSPDDFDLKLTPSGKTGIEIYSEWKPDILVIDIGLHDISGYLVLQMIRKDCQDHDTPVIIASARSSIEDIQACGRLGIQGYMVKPFSRRQICGEILHCVNVLKLKKHETVVMDDIPSKVMDNERE